LNPDPAQVAIDLTNPAIVIPLYFALEKSKDCIWAASDGAPK
jgi:hypothetical protein